MPLFQHATYATSVAHPGDPYPYSVAEVAFAGRSNAGKSSAINTLANRRRLAFVSKTPGRTQLINFFTLGQDRYLVDLPGYGYASAPGEVRAQWDRLLGGYMRERQPLKGLALIMDIRRPLTELDLQLIEFFLPTGKPVHVLLTKADKLARVSAQAVLRDVRRKLGQLSTQYSAQLFSSLKRTGIEESEAVFGQWLEADRPAHLASPGTTFRTPRARE